MKRYTLTTISDIIDVREHHNGEYVLYIEHLLEQRKCWRSRFVQSCTGYALGCLMTSLAALAWWAIQ